jgi:4-amino-4-deoxy-L-arabinose transferase-like glycosyltransferase
MSRKNWFGLSIILCGFLVVVGIALADNNAFGYDESVYALLARHWIDGGPISGWGIHRPILLSVLGLIPALLGGHEWAFRVVGILFGSATVVAMWYFGRGAGGSAAAPVAALAVATASSFQVESSTFLTDVPSTFLLLLLAGLLWRDLSGSRPIGRRFLWLAPLAAAAFYLRYGAIVGIGALVIATTVASPHRLIASWRIVTATAGLFMLLLVPHLVLATATLGTPWGVISLAEANAAPTGGQVAFSQYLGLLPWSLMGPLGGPLAIGGLVTIIATLTIGRRSASPPIAPRLASFIGLAVLAQVVILGILVHAEIRYLFFPTLLLVVAGATGVAALLDPIPAPGQLASLVVVGVGGFVLSLSLTTTEVVTRGFYSDWMRDAGTYLAARSSAGCSVMTADAPIITWYSRCLSYRFGSPADPKPLAVLTGPARYVIVRSAGVNQPVASVLERFYLPHAIKVREFYDRGGHLAAGLYRIQQ